jgi:hypothetical protein
MFRWAIELTRLSSISGLKDSPVNGTSATVFRLMSDS